MNTKLMALKVAARYHKTAGCGCGPECTCGGDCGCGGESKGNYMAPQALESLRSHAEALQAKIDAGDEIPDWVEYKLAQAAQMMTDLMEYYEHSPSQKFAGLRAPDSLVRMAEAQGISRPFSDWEGMVHYIFSYPLYDDKILESGFELDEDEAFSGRHVKGKAWVVFQGGVVMPWKELGHYLARGEVKVLIDWLQDRQNQKEFCALLNNAFKRGGEKVMKDSAPPEDALHEIIVPDVDQLDVEDDLLFLEASFKCKGVTSRGLLLEVDYREERDAMGDFRP